MQLDFDLRPDEDLPYSALARLRSAGPVVWSDSLGGWLVTSADAVRTVLSDVTRFTSAGTPVAEVFGTEGMLVNDTPTHHAIRVVWAKHVSRGAMAARRDELEAYAAAVLEAAQPALQRGEAVDFVPLFRQLVLAFIASSFAVPQDRSHVFESWAELSADTPALGLEAGSPEHQRHEAAKQDVYRLIREQVEDRRRRFRGDENPVDLIALMVAAEGPDGITEAIVFDNIFNFILGAFDTTEKWLGNALTKLYASPDILRELRAERGLIEPFMEEVMRFDTVAQVIQRRVREGGAELGNQNLKGGDTLYVMLGAANRDAREFENPDRFDLHRTPKPNFGFGFGFHHCLGINIARQETLAFVKMLLDRLPDLAVVACDRGASWALWGPRSLLLQLPGAPRSHT